MKRVHVTITGMVQGVFFRAKTRNEAIRNNVSGWVRNLPDGRVEAVFEGKPEDVDRVVGWCRIGPSLAAVDECRNARGSIHGSIYGLQYPIRALRNETGSDTD